MEKLSSSQKNKIAQSIFFIAFVMEILIRSVNSAGVEIPYRTRLMQLAAVLFFVKILLTKYSKKEWCIIVATAILTVIPFFTIRDTLWIEIAMMLIAAKDVCKEKCIRFYFVLLGITMVALAVLSGVGIIDNFVLIENFSRGGIETRYAFGFSHPNVFYSNLLILTAMGLYVFFDKLKGWHFFVLTVLNVFFMTLCKSRTGFLVVQVLIIAMFIVAKWPKLMENKMVYYLEQGAVGMMILLSYSIYFLDWKYLLRLNDILTGRIWFAVHKASIFKWEMFPVNRKPVVVDMGFVHVMHYWGIILGTIYIIFIFWNYKKLSVKRDGAALVILLSYTLFTVIEAHAFSMFFVGNLMFILMIGWGKEQYNVSAEKSNS